MAKFSWKVIVLFLCLASALALSMGGGTAQATPAQQEPPKLNTAVVTGTVVLPGRAMLDALQFHYVDVSPAIRIYPKTELYQTAVTQGLVQEGDLLLWPMFYPVPDSVAKTIQQLAGERSNCHRPVYVQYIKLSSL